MIHKLVKFLIVFTAWSLLSCNGNIERLDTSELKEEMDNRKIKKISESDITLSVNKRGSEIERVLLSNNCEVVSARLDSLEGVLKYKLEVIEVLNYTPVIEKEKEMIEAIKYALENGDDFQSTYQKLSDSLYVFYFPLNKVKCNEFAQPESEGFGKISFTKTDIIRGL